MANRVTRKTCNTPHWIRLVRRTNAGETLRVQVLSALNR